MNINLSAYWKINESNQFISICGDDDKLPFYRGLWKTFSLIILIAIPAVFLLFSVAFGLGYLLH
ncbi:hypothetical protein [Oceanobacillus sp. FSL W7-1281]|uniref:hypothetical protein n=1 Tax=Oceanobacillus sp. FSL W7-1281 TaxID=2921698 RepID=UPI0030DC33B3